MARQPQPEPEPSPALCRRCGVAEESRLCPGCRQTIDRLVTENQRLVGAAFASIAWMPAVLLLGPQEAKSAGLFALMQAAEKWDEARGTKFSTYATWAIRNEIVSEAVKNAKRAAREGQGDADRLDEVPAPEPRKRPRLKRSAVQVRLRSAMKQLPPKLLLVVRWRVLRGATKEEVAKKLKTSVDEVTRLHRRALRLLREMLGEQGQLEFRS